MWWLKKHTSMWSMIRLTNLAGNRRREMHIRIFLTAVIIIFNMTSICGANGEAGLPVKFIEGCEVDLNNDGKHDVSLLIETSEGYQLIVLFSTAKGYDSHIVAKFDSKMNLSCAYGKTLESTVAGKGKIDRKLYDVNGPYLLLSLPESSAVAYFWNNNGFQEVWVRD